MRRSASLIVATIALFASTAAAQQKDAGKGAPSSSASAASSVSTTAPSSTGSAGALPPGHPPVGGAPGNDPHAGGMQDSASGALAGMFQPPEDSEHEDTSLPAGTIAVELRDADDKPIPNREVDLGIVVQSIAKGESRKHEQSKTDAQGKATFSGLETGSGFAYRVTSPNGGGTFAAAPFMLAQGPGMRVRLHVYDVTHDPNEISFVNPQRGEMTGLLSEAVVYAELKDDRIQFEEVLTFFNLGKVAWVPEDVVLPLPEGFTALTAQQAMSDQGVDPLDKQGARLRGTFAPGRHVIEFRWQLPWSGDKDIEADIGMPPHVFHGVVMTPAADPIKLVVDKFPEPTRRADNNGQPMFVTETAVREQPLTRIHMQLRDLPTPGPARFVATSLASCGVLVGIALAVSQRRRNGEREATKPGDPKARRKALLAELEELELAHRAGDVGPKTYERARRDLIDAIARTLQ